MNVTMIRKVLVTDGAYTPQSVEKIQVVEASLVFYEPPEDRSIVAKGNWQITGDVVGSPLPKIEKAVGPKCGNALGYNSGRFCSLEVGHKGAHSDLDPDEIPF